MRILVTDGMDKSAMQALRDAYGAQGYDLHALKL